MDMFVVADRFFADILLAPLEATRIRLVSDPKVSPLSLSYLSSPRKIALYCATRSLYATVYLK
jgi:hypothetical protein